LSNPDIDKVAATSDKIGGRSVRIADAYDWEGNTDSTKMAIHIAYVDYNFVDVYNIEIVSGRFFSRDFVSDSTAIVLNEAAIKEMRMDNPVGKKGPFETNIIGVVKDFNFASLRSKIEPIGFFLNPGGYAFAAIKIKSANTPATLEHIRNTFSAYASDFPFEYQFLDDVLDMQYRSEERLGTIFKYFSILAIFISCLGLLGLASYAAEMRTKEIGIRKVLGATISGIIRLMTKEFIMLVVIANVIAWPIAYYTMNKWLQDFAYRVSIEWKLFIISAIITLLVALLTVSYQAFKVARTNPVETLKYE
jgi:putative ABC transport system permease protein